MFIKTIDTQIKIYAAADQVWHQLVDFSAYSQWNPFIVNAEGILQKGQRLAITILPHKTKNNVTFTPKLSTVESGKVLEWVGSLPVPGLFKGKHQFILTPQDDHIVLVQRERFTGLLIPLMGKLLKQSEAGFNAMNQALKQRCETKQSF